jgi:hypothetical protein
MISPLLVLYATTHQITLAGPIFVTTVVGVAIFLVAVLLSPETKGKVLLGELTVARGLHSRRAVSCRGGKAGPLKSFFNHLLKRIGAENFPPVLLAEAAPLLGAHRAGRQLGHFLDIAAGHRSV